MSAPKPAKSAPERTVLTGRYARLEPLALHHAADLFTASQDATLFAYLFDHPVDTVEDMTRWIEAQMRSADPLFFAVIDTATGKCLGRQAFMRIVPEHGVIEIGSILWGPGMARTRLATEALYLFAHNAFETLGYRRFEWKCNALNLPSRRAAERFGFRYEGTFRQHMIIKGENRDTAWFAMTDGDWQRIKPGYDAWLDPANFDADGIQNTPLLFG